MGDPSPSEASDPGERRPTGVAGAAFGGGSRRTPLPRPARAATPWNRCSCPSSAMVASSESCRLRRRSAPASSRNLIILPCDVMALISRHADGELLAQVCRWFGLRTVRGSSGRGGVDAVEELLRLQKGFHLLVAPDGPLGPRRQVKRGLVYLASWTGMPIVPLGVGFQRAWRLNSWDRMALPKPLSTITCIAGPLIRVPSVINKADSDHYRRLVEQNMAIATSAAEAWAAGEKPAIP